MKKNMVYIIGAGPGMQDLITVRGLKILQQAEVVIYDYLVDKKILEFTTPGTELICCDELDKEKYSNGFLKRHDIITMLIIKKVKEGKKVVRLKNGDPMIFSRTAEELESLTKNKIKFSIVPGVTAGTASACYCGIPLTARGISSSVVITTGYETSEKDSGYVDWNKISQIDTIVLYMAVENISYIVKKLFSAGKKEITPVAVVSNVSKINQKVISGTLKNITEKVRQEKISAPAIVIIGDIVQKEKQFNWFKKIKKILFTGISNERFFEEGMIFHIPMIEIIPLDDYANVDTWIKKIFYKPSILNYQPIIDWIVFSSRFGVQYFFQRLFQLKKDSRWLNKTKIAAIGRSTANKLKEYGITADMVPQKECSYGLIEEFKKIIKSSTIIRPPSDIRYKPLTILLPRSDIADKGLTDGLKKLGAKVYPCVVYRNVMPKNLPDLDLNFFDEIIFSSPSTVKNFIKRYGKPPKKIKIRTIGPVTKKEAQKWRLL